MSNHQFGSGLDDVNSEPIEPQSSLSETDLESQDMTGTEESENHSTSEPELKENRKPFFLDFSPDISGMPLDLGAHAKATLVYFENDPWLICLDGQGLLKIGKVQFSEFPKVGELIPLFPDHKWTVFDARTCDQTGNIIWAGICKTSGDLYGSVEIHKVCSGQTVSPQQLGKADALELPTDPSRIEAMQLTDWFGRDRLDLLVHVKPLREPGGHSLQLLERKSDHFLEGYLPLQLTDSETDKFLSAGDSTRLLQVAWSGPGTDQFLYFDQKSQLHLLNNFGGALPPGTGKARTVSCSETNSPASPGASISSLAWVKPFQEQKGGLIAVSSTGNVSLATIGSLNSLSSFQPVLSEFAGELVFGPHAVVTAADWNNDGGLDLIAGDASGGLTLYQDCSGGEEPRYEIPVKLESGGLPFLVPNRDSRRAATLNSQNPRYSCPVLNDWTAFQRFDVLVSDARGAVWYMRNNGGKTQPRLDFADRITSAGGPLFVSARSQLAVGHWSGRNEPDVIGFDTDGDLAFWQRNEKLDLKAGVKILDVRKRPISLGGTGKRTGLVNLWAGSWTSPDAVELILAMPFNAIGRLADWLEIPIEKPLNEFPLFWLLQNTPHGVTANPLRTSDGKLIHDQFPSKADSYSVSGVKIGGRSSADLLIVPSHGRAMIWPRESLRWD